MNKNIENLIYIPSSPYVQAIIKYAEKVAPEKNKYIIMDSPRGSMFLAGVEDKVCIAPFGSDAFWEYVGQLASYERIIVNYPNKSTAWLINQIPSNLTLKVIWVFWSGELYNLPQFLPKVYQPFSRKFIFTRRFFSSLLKEELKAFIFGKLTYRKLIKSFSRFTHFACIVQGDYENVKRMLRISPTFVPFSFQSYLDMFSTPEMVSENRNKVMIGHSGAPEINHFEAFQLLKKLNVSNPLFCPLAYGNKNYIQKIIEEGNLMFEGKIEFLTEFLSKDKYYKELQTVGFAIFNLNIQQGFGNIIGLVWLGVKVFLRKSNSIYGQLKDWGIHVFSIEEDLTETSLKTPLDIEQIAQNKTVIETIFSENKVLEYYRNILHI